MAGRLELASRQLLEIRQLLPAALMRIEEFAETGARARRYDRVGGRSAATSSEPERLATVRADPARQHADTIERRLVQVGEICAELRAQCLMRGR